VEKEFETLITSFINEKVGITNHFLSDTLAQHLKEHVLQLQSQNKLMKAGIGNKNNLQHNDEIRGDSIYWLDREHDNEYENDFLDQIDDFIIYLNRSCFAGITGYEFHYSIYEIGTFYKKHIDQFQNNDSRKFSMISYLNSEWKAADGGELIIYGLNMEQEITPTNGKTVFFKSNELPHEVLITNERRVSITGWLTS